MWKNFTVDEFYVVRATEKAVLVRLPKKSGYKDFCFWYPKKLVRDGFNPGELSFGVKDDMSVKARLTDKNYKVIDEVDLSASDLLGINFKIM